MEENKILEKNAGELGSDMAYETAEPIIASVDVAQEPEEFFEVTRGKAKRDAIKEEMKAEKEKAETEDVAQPAEEEPAVPQPIVNELNIRETIDELEDDEESWTEYKHRILDKVKEQRTKCKGKVILAVAEVFAMLTAIETEIKN